jgi:hypothetical protein
LRTEERTYIIKTGDTLHKVAQELAIPPMELRRHHNIYCEIPDLIEADFPRHLKVLLLPPDKIDITSNSSLETKPRKVSFSKGSTIPFLPAGSQKNYNVKYTIEEGDEKDILNFETNVKWIAIDKNGFHLFEIKRAKTIYINTIAPDTMMDEMDAKTAEALYPLQVVVDSTGKWVDVYNYNEIQERWENTKKEILDYYEGDVTQIHIKHVERYLETKANLVTALNSDYFLRAFFNGIHVAYTREYTFENNITFPLIKEEEALFKVQQKVELFLEENHTIKVEQTGDYVDIDLEFELDPWEGSYKATYFLNPDSYCIEKMELECCINYDSPVKSTITIESVEEVEIQKINTNHQLN